MNLSDVEAIRNVLVMRMRNTAQIKHPIRPSHPARLFTITKLMTTYTKTSFRSSGRIKT